MALPDHSFDDDGRIVLPRRTHGAIEDVTTKLSQLLAAGKRVGAGVGVSRYGHLFLNVDDVFRARLEANVREDWLDEAEGGPEVMAAGARNAELLTAWLTG